MAGPPTFRCSADQNQLCFPSSEDGPRSANHGRGRVASIERPHSRAAGRCNCALAPLLTGDNSKATPSLPPKRFDDHSPKSCDRPQVTGSPRRTPARCPERTGNWTRRIEFPHATAPGHGPCSAVGTFIRGSISSTPHFCSKSIRDRVSSHSTQSSSPLYSTHPSTAGTSLSVKSGQ